MTLFVFVFFSSGQLCVTFVFAEAIVSSGKTEKSPHDQEIKFFAKVSDSLHLTGLPSSWDLYHLGYKLSRSNNDFDEVDMCFSVVERS